MLLLCRRQRFGMPSAIRKSHAFLQRLFSSFRLGEVYQRTCAPVSAGSKQAAGEIRSMRWDVFRSAVYGSKR